MPSTCDFVKLGVLKRWFVEAAPGRPSTSARHPSQWRVRGICTIIVCLPLNFFSPLIFEFLWTSVTSNNFAPEKNLEKACCHHDFHAINTTFTKKGIKSCRFSLSPCINHVCIFRAVITWRLSADLHM